MFGAAGLYGRWKALHIKPAMARVGSLRDLSVSLRFRAWHRQAFACPWIAASTHRSALRCDNSESRNHHVIVARSRHIDCREHASDLAALSVLCVNVLPSCFVPPSPSSPARSSPAAGPATWGRANTRVTSRQIRHAKGHPSVHVEVKTAVGVHVAPDQRRHRPRSRVASWPAASADTRQDLLRGRQRGYARWLEVDGWPRPVGKHLFSDRASGPPRPPELSG